MSALNWLKTPALFIKKNAVANAWVRTFITGIPALQKDASEDSNTNDQPRREVHPLSVCLRYMKSKAYQKTYGDKPVWQVYVRNFKGQYPSKTRKNCVFPSGVMKESNPCPICRDCYLMPHYTNVELLKQFISSDGGEILDSKKTGVCQKQQQNILVAIKKAKDYGYLTFHVPHRHYEYNLYNKK